MKSIRSKIRVVVLALVIASSILIGAVTALMNAWGIEQLMEATAGPAARITARAVKWKLNDYWLPLTEAAERPVFRDRPSTDPELVAQTKEIASRNGFIYVGKMDRQGVASTGNYYGDTDYFLKCKQTVRPVISDPIYDGNQVIFLLEAPIVKDGQFDGVVYGAVTADFLTEIVGDLAIGDAGKAYILDDQGNVIGHPDPNYVADGVNIIQQAKTDPSMAQIAEVHKAMLAGETGITTYELAGDNKCFAYTPVGGEQGWSLGVEISHKEFKGPLDLSILVTLAIVLLVVAIACLVTMKLSQRISEPIKQLQKVTHDLSQGILDTEISYRSKDELGALSDDMRIALADLKAYVRDISRGTAAVAAGDLTVRPNVEYKGDFVAIEDNMYHLIQKLNETLGQINSSSEVVSMSANNVADGARILSEGCAEQEGAVVDLSDTVNEIHEKMQSMAQEAAQADHRANDVGTEMQASNDEMEEMIRAMGEIEDSSQQIEKIIKTIEDIAFQTNILALNAAVEAARAGAAGKGFSVVADEVRNLASKSAEASQNSTILIQRSMQAVKNGTRIADETARTLKSAVSDAGEVIASIARISATATDQSQQLTQVAQDLERVSQIVQTNVSTAEESAAASQELAGQSALLEELASKFHSSQAEGGLDARYAPAEQAVS